MRIAAVREPNAVAARSATQLSPATVHGVVRLFAAIFVGVTLSCAALPDAGAATVEGFFRDLEQHRFEAAADRVRGHGGASLSPADRAVFVRGWRKGYEGYTIRFEQIVVHRVDAAPEHLVRSAGASEGWVYAVKFRGQSDSPCVPVNSDVIPGTTAPIAIRLASGWYLHREGIVGFVHNCPGG